MQQKMQIQNTASSRTAATATAAANMIALQSERVHVTAEWYLLNHLHTQALAGAHCCTTRSHSCVNAFVQR